jgi:hypothetical protein
MKVLRYLFTSYFDKETTPIENFPETQSFWDNYTPEVSIGSIVRFYANINTEIQLVNNNNQLSLPRAEVKIYYGMFLPENTPPLQKITNTTCFKIGRTNVGAFQLDQTVALDNAFLGLDIAMKANQFPMPTTYLKSYVIEQNNQKLWGIKLWGYFVILTDMDDYYGNLTNKEVPYLHIPYFELERNYPYVLSPQIIDIRNSENKSVFNPANNGFKIFRTVINIQSGPNDNIEIIDKKVSFRYWNRERNYRSINSQSDLLGFRYKSFVTVDPDLVVKDPLIGPNDCPGFTIQQEVFFRHFYRILVECEFVFKASVLESGKEPVLMPLLFLTSNAALNRNRGGYNNLLFETGLVRYYAIPCENPDCNITQLQPPQFLADKDYHLHTPVGNYHSIYFDEFIYPLKVEKTLQNNTVKYKVTYLIDSNRIYDFIRNKYGRNLAFNYYSLCKLCIAHVIAYYPFSPQDAARKNLAKTYSIDCFANEAHNGGVGIFEDGGTGGGGTGGGTGGGPNANIKPAARPELKIYFKDQINTLYSDAIISTPEERLICNFQFFAERYELTGESPRRRIGIDLVRDAYQINIYVYYRIGDSPANARYVLLDRQSAYKEQQMWSNANNPVSPIEIIEVKQPIEEKSIIVAYKFRNRFEALEPAIGIIRRDLNPQRDYIAIAINNPSSVSPSSIYANQDWSQKDIFIECEILIKGPVDNPMLEDRFIAKAINRVKDYDRRPCLTIKPLPLGSPLSMFDRLEPIKYFCENIYNGPVTLVTSCLNTNNCKYKYATNLVQQEVYNAFTAKEINATVFNPPAYIGPRWEKRKDSPLDEITDYNDNCFSTVNVKIQELALNKRHKFVSIAKNSVQNSGGRVGNVNAVLLLLSPVLPNIRVQNFLTIPARINDLIDINSEKLFLAMALGLEDTATVSNISSTFIKSGIFVQTPNGEKIYFYVDTNL